MSEISLVYNNSVTVVAKQYVQLCFFELYPGARGLAVKYFMQRKSDIRTKMLLSVGITELLHAFAVVVWLFQVPHFANQINQTHSISGTALSSIGIYAINKQWKASSNSVTIWPTSLNWSNFVFKSKIIQCILKNNDFKAGAVQICVEFLAKIMVFFLKSSIFTTAWPAILFVPQHIPSLEFYAEDQADLGQMAPPTPLPGHSAWWRLSGFWCRHLILRNGFWKCQKLEFSHELSS